MADIDSYEDYQPEQELYDASDVKDVSDISGEIIEPGLYHAKILGFERFFSASGKEGLAFLFQILNGTVPGYEGRKIRETFWKSDHPLMIRRKVRFAIAAGLLRPGEKKQLKPEDFVGHELVIEIGQREYQGKTFANVTLFGFWPLGHPDVKHVPLGRNSADEALDEVLPPEPPQSKNDDQQQDEWETL